MYQSFASLIYVTQTEHDAVMRMYPWEEFRIEGDDQLYYRTSIEKNEKQVMIFAARQGEMGMTASATLSMKLIQHFKPRYLIMPGIAAGAQTSDE